MSKNKRPPLNAFSDLKAALEQGTTITVFADVRPPRYDHHNQVWIVRRHTGEETVEHKFDTEREAQAFYDAHNKTTNQ